MSEKPITVQFEGETIHCRDYANDVMEILMKRSKSTSTLWQNLLPLLWEIEAANHHLDNDLLFEKLLVEAKLFNRMRTGQPST